MSMSTRQMCLTLVCVGMHPWHAPVCLGLVFGGLHQLVDADGAVFGCGTVEPGWVASTLCVWSCDAFSGAGAMWCCAAAGWDQADVQYFIAQPPDVSRLVQQRTQAAESAQTTAGAAASDGWSKLIPLQPTATVSIPLDVRHVRASHPS